MHPTVPSPPPLRQAFTSPEAKRQFVRRLFATIAPRYDLITVLLSYGQDRRWKRQLVELAGITPGTRVLDLASGTGDLALLAASRGAAVVALDVTHDMLVRARRKPDGRRLRAVTADMSALPAGAASFDVVTTGYGLRNVPDLPLALREAHRVLAPGGRLLSLDFNRPDHPLPRAVFLVYLTVVGSVLGTLLHRDPDTYRYIPESIRRYPGAAGVCRLAREAGFRTCRHRPILGGFMAMHVMEK